MSRILSPNQVHSDTLELRALSPSASLHDNYNPNLEDTMENNISQEDINYHADTSLLQGGASDRTVSSK